MTLPFNQSSADMRKTARGILDSWGVEYTREPNGSLLITGDMWDKGPAGLSAMSKMRTLAKQLLGDDRALIIYNMAEFAEEYSRYRITGVPPGYSGFEEGSPLANEVRKRPKVLLVMDEIEKGKAEVVAILDRVLADGMLTDGTGRQASMEGVIPIKLSAEVSRLECGHRERERLDKFIAHATVLRRSMTVRKPLQLKQTPAVAS